VQESLESLMVELGISEGCSKRDSCVVW